MTKKQIVYEAAELIEKRYIRSMCLAINSTNNPACLMYDNISKQDRLVKELAKFYDKHSGEFWYPKEKRYKEERVLALLFFAEVGLK